jgi:hypothetical protein
MQKTDAERYHFFLTYDKKHIFPPRIPDIYTEWCDKITKIKEVALINKVDSYYELKEKVNDLASKIILSRKLVLKNYLEEYIELETQ